YGFRLDLLLSKWDQFRGVKRLYVDNPDAKRRFLRQLAYKIHSAKKRRRTIDLVELEEVYGEALGKWGYDFDFAKIIKDLVVGSGLIIEERPGVFSFGHLTFQEHLVGEYITKFSIPQIASLLGDDWWREPLKFYASLVGNIDELVDYLMNDTYFSGYAKQLAEMITYAPYTSPGAVDCVEASML
ncbi:MAG: hypothetical protein QG588_2131, partial [Candidatus Poribacteria bacterium]|nr:hypothetical protein [Candidatus Poribacteria bacterium]